MTRPRLDGISDFHFQCTQCRLVSVVPALCITPDEEVFRRPNPVCECGSGTEFVEVNRCITCAEMEWRDGA